MGYTYASNMRTMLAAEMSQFTGDVGTTNLGVGYAGWDDAYEYHRKNNQKYFGSIFLMSGDDQSPQAMGKGMWRWSYIVRLHSLYDGKNAQLSDQNVMDLASDFMDTMTLAVNKQTINSTGWVRVIASSYLSNPLKINGVLYYTTEFIVAVQEQLQG